MLDWLRRPVPPFLLMMGTLGAALAIALYCVAYTTLIGQPETIGDALAWAIANVCTWLVAFEAAKRSTFIAGVFAVVAIACLTSVLLGYFSGASTGPIAFELLRRLPAILVLSFALAVIRSPIGRRAPTPNEFPLLPRQIDWVSAAGNYIELHANGRVVVHRASIAAAERQLISHGFVRVHRSYLVQRDRIACAGQSEVVLTDGVRLKVGKRYRAMLAS